MTAPLSQLWTAPRRPCRHVIVAVALLAAAPFVQPAPAAAQSRDVAPLINQVERLERQLQALERTVYRGSPPPAGAAAAAGSVPPAAVSQLQVKSGQLEEQMRTLTGQIEEMGFRINQLNSRLDRLVADVDFRLRALESGNPPAGAAPAPTVDAAPPAPLGSAPADGDVVVDQEGAPGPSGRFGNAPLTATQLEAANVQAGSGATQDGTQQASAGVAAAAALPPGSPQDRYNYARSFLMRRDFAGAERALRAFVETYPESELAGNAQYWLGETYYVRNNFGIAAQTFAEGFQRYPDSSKAPDNLLKLGMSLAALDRTEDACITLAKLDSEYPQAPANIKRRADQERSRLQCR